MLCRRRAAPAATARRADAGRTPCSSDSGAMRRAASHQAGCARKSSARRWTCGSGRPRSRCGSRLRRAASHPLPPRRSPRLALARAARILRRRRHRDGIEVPGRVRRRARAGRLRPVPGAEAAAPAQLEPACPSTPREHRRRAAVARAPRPQRLPARAGARRLPRPGLLHAARRARSAGSCCPTAAASRKRTPPTRTGTGSRSTSRRCRSTASATREPALEQLRAVDFGETLALGAAASRASRRPATSSAPPASSLRDASGALLCLGRPRPLRRPADAPADTSRRRRLDRDRVDLRRPQPRASAIRSRRSPPCCAARSSAAACS